MKTQPQVRSIWGVVAKRILDVIGASLGLVLFSPIFLIVGILVKLQDGGPIFHRRRVVGPEGPFDAFKFRSMHPNADAMLQGDSRLREAFSQNFKLKHDSRVTPLGAILRKYSLDELPQLYNVLRGQMSLVGPRMITEPELEKYGPYQPLLLSVKPGLTGYWQVRGRQEIDYSRRVQLDVFYIRNWTLMFDLRILLRTPWVVLKGSGAI